MIETKNLSLLILILSFLLTAALEKALIPILKRSAKQPIYEGGPSWHISKSGTPTMGGIAFLAVVISQLILSAFYISKREGVISLLLSLLFAVLNSAVGIIDDLTKLRRQENAGLTPRQKLILQFLTATVFILLRVRLLGADTEISLPFFKIDIGFFYYPLMIIMLVGLVNSANLTDGIDGLSASVALSASAMLLFITDFSIPELSFTASSLIGAMLGFLLFNFHPAKIFMGDTGSLFIGALLASSAMSLKNPLLMILICGVYVLEGISVILQVVFYKLTHKRLFKMAPLHHHLEKCGLSETKICALGAAFTLGMSAIAYLLY